MKNIILAMTILVVASSAQAYRYSAQEIDSIDQYCTSTAGIVGDIHHKAYNRLEIDWDEVDRLMAAKDGAIFMWSFQYVTKNVDLPYTDHVMRTVYSKCLDNAKRLLLGIKNNKPVKLHELR